MKIKICEKCKTKYNALTVSACPICREIRQKAIWNDTTEVEQLEQYKKYKRKVNRSRGKLKT